MTTKWNALLIASVAIAAGDGLGLAQAPAPAEMAARLTGTWTLNAGLTPAAPPSRRGRGRIDERTPSLAPARMDVQRGGRGGAGGGGFGGGESSALTDGEIAAQAALTLLHQVPLEVTIEATPDAVTFREPGGEWMFKIDGKTTTMAVPGATLRSKSKWDHAALRQEFSSVQRKLVKSWSIDADERLVLNEEVESLTSHTQSKAIFDRRRADAGRTQAP